MSRAPLFFLPLLVLCSIWAGRAVPDGSGWIAAVVLSLVGIFGMVLLQRAPLRRLSREVNAWMGKVAIEPVAVGRGHDLQEFASVLNALGAAYGRRGLRVRESGPNLRGLIAALPDPALLFDEDLALVATNDRARELFQVAEGPTTALQSLGSGALVDLLGRCAADGELHRTQVRLGDRIVEAAATPLAGKLLLLAHDRTRDAMLETLRRDFVANASHELKSPVAGIQSLAEALEVVVERDPSRAGELVERLRSEAVRLAALVVDLLDLGRVDEPLGDEPVADVALAPLVEDAVAILADVARDRGVGVAVRAAVAGHVRVVAEDLRLVVGNLVDNAIKYNRRGGQVTVTITHDAQHVVLEVADTGIGIPLRDLTRIFERFYRVDEGRSRASGGTGLGLAIVRHAVERHGGQVQVESLLGVGSTFRVLFPAGDPGAVDPEGTSQPGS